MGFTSRRGRPKREQDEIDTGTPELRRKQRQKLTIEPLDWLREKELISPQQHWCALHFRWLYTLRYGTTTPQSIDTAQEKGIIHKREYEAWQADREEEWKQATQLLKSLGGLKTALDHCVYLQNIPLQWQLHPPHHIQTIPLLQECFSQLEKLWCRRITF